MSHSRISFLALLILVIASFSIPAQAAERTIHTRGLMLEIENGQLVVAGVIPGSPAAKAGVMKGDVIVKCNETVVSQKTMWQAADTIFRIDMRNIPVSLQLKHQNGGTITVSLQGADVPVTYATIPRTSMPEGSILDSGSYNERPNRSPYPNASFRDLNKLSDSDEYLVFLNGTYVGRALVLDFKHPVKLGLQITNPLPRKHTPPGTFSNTSSIPHDPYAGARLVFYQHSDNYFKNASAGRGDFGTRTAFAVQANPVKQQFEDLHMKGVYKYTPTAPVTKLTATSFQVSFRTSSTTAGGLYSISYDRDIVTMLITFGPDTKFIISGDARYADVNGRQYLRNGRPVSVYYKREGNINRAYLIEIGEK